MSNEFFSIKKMRVLHFEKIVPWELQEDQTALLKAENPEARGKSRKEIIFCTLGYYDRLTYVRVNEEDDIFENKHSFLIKYPYRKKEQPIIADQMFSVFEKAEECTSVEIDDRDPFEYAGESSKPFLGIILITVYEKLSEAGGQVYKSKELMELCKSNIKRIIEKEYADDCCKIFYTPNCADLCVVIRTDNMQHIARLKRTIAHLQYGEKDKPGRCHTTTYTMLQPPKEMDAVSQSHDFLDKNRDIKFELRLSCGQAFIHSIHTELQKSGGCVDEITGNGEYAVEMPFHEFMNLYSTVWAIKTGEHAKAEEQTKAEEQVKAEEQTKAAGNTQLQKLFLENGQQVRCTYIRAKYPLGLIDPDQDELDIPNTSIVKKYEGKLNSLLIQIKNHTNLDTVVKNQIRERIMLVKELTYTYSDFLFQSSSWWKGIVFYIQIEGIIKGIDQYLKKLEVQDDITRENSEGQHDIISEKDKEILTVKLYSDINKSISCVNNFNKLLQSMNQYIINIPNYEMQTKVNVEKYLMAYTMYLFEISSRYFNSGENKPKEKVLPLLTIDRTEEGIQAYTFFGALKEANTDSYTFFSVLCPNYQWFANIYHVLPMITHEISHNFRYIERNERNEKVLEFVLANLTKKFVQELLASSIENYNGFFEEREKFFIRIFSEVFVRKCKEGLSGNIPDLKLRVFRNALLQAFVETAGIESGANQDVSFWEFVKDEMLQLFDITAMEFCTSGEVAVKNLTMDEIEKIFVNMLLDVLCMDKETGKKWLGKIREIQKIEQDEKNLIANMEEVLEKFLGTEEVELDNILVVLLMYTRYFLEYLYSGILDISAPAVKNCIEHLEKWEVEECLNEISGNTSGSNGLCADEQTFVLEKIYNFCTHYIKLKTGVLLQKDSVLKKRNSTAEETAKEIHKNLHEEYAKLLKQRNAPNNVWLTFKENQRLFASLGIINSESDHFVREYKQFIKRMSEEDIRKRVDELIQLYEEVFADLSMCEAFNFTASGYLMYTTHIFMKERSCPSDSTYDNVYNMTLDRICTVLFTKYEDTYQKSLEQTLTQYYDDLMKYLSKEEIESADRGAVESIESSYDNSLLQHVEMYKWTMRFYEGIEEHAKTYKNDSAIMDLYNHIKEVIKKIQDEKWIQKLKNETALKDIRAYYNAYSYSETKNRKREGRFLFYQNEFVLDYYARMKDCILGITQEKNIEDIDLLEGLFKVTLDGDENDD